MNEEQFQTLLPKFKDKPTIPNSKTITTINYRKYPEIRITKGIVTADKSVDTANISEA